MAPLFIEIKETDINVCLKLLIFVLINYTRQSWKILNCSEIYYHANLKSNLNHVRKYFKCYISTTDGVIAHIGDTNADLFEYIYTLYTNNTEYMKYSLYNMNISYNLC